MIKNIFYRYRWILVALIFTNLSFIIHPQYTTLTYDQKIYLPPLIGKISSLSLSGDTLSMFNHGSITIFDNAISLIVNHIKISLFKALFGITYLTRLIFFVSIIYISKSLTRSSFSIAISLFFLFAPLPIFRFGIDALSSELVPRDIANAIGLLSIVFLIKNKLKTSLLLQLLSTLIHAPSGVFYIICWLYSNIKNKKYIPKIGAITVMFFALVLALVFCHHFSDLLTKMTSEEVEFNRYRNYAIFLSMWNIKGISIQWLVVLVGYILAIVYLYRQKRTHSLDFLVLSLIIPNLLTLITYIGLDLFNIRLFYIALLHRSFFAFQLIGRLAFFIALTTILIEEINTINRKNILKILLVLWSINFLIFNQINPGINIIVIMLFSCFFVVILKKCMNQIFYTITSSPVSTVILSILIAGSSVVVSKNTKIYPDFFSDHSLSRLCQWLKLNNQENPVLTDSLETELRVSCITPVYYSWSAGGMGLFHPQLIPIWQKRKIEQSILTTSNLTNRSTIPTNSRFFITIQKNLFSTKPIYQAGKYSVYLF